METRKDFTYTPARPPALYAFSQQTMHARRQKKPFLPRVSLGSRFSLTHPMLPGATSNLENPCKCLDNIMIIPFTPVRRFSDLGECNELTFIMISSPTSVGHGYRPCKPLGTRPRNSQTFMMISIILAYDVPIVSSGFSLSWSKPFDFHRDFNRTGEFL